MTTKRDFPGLLEHAQRVCGDLSDCTEYLDFVRRQICLVCAKRSDPHHVKTRGAGGSDFLAANLCREHHTEIGQIGILRFEKKYNVDIEKAIREMHRRYAGEQRRKKDIKNLLVIKKCSKCGDWKELGEFFKGNDKYNLCYICKLCAGIYSEANKDKRKAYLKANKDKIKANQKAYYESHKDKRKAYHKSHKDEIKAKNRIYHQMICIKLGDVYIKRILTVNCSLCHNDIPPELIELKRKHIELKRLKKAKINPILGV